MQNIGSRNFIEIPGERIHELPPLVLADMPGASRKAQILTQAEGVVESEEDIRPHNLAGNLDSRKMDLALTLAEQYHNLVAAWRLGDSVHSWIGDCEYRFRLWGELRHVIRPDIWPHAGRSSFVRLLVDKGVCADQPTLETAVGMRLTFRQPPPLKCFSDHFLMYLRDRVTQAAYQTWAGTSTGTASDLPPERFTIQVVQTTLDL